MTQSISTLKSTHAFRLKPKTNARMVYGPGFPWVYASDLVTDRAPAALAPGGTMAVLKTKPGGAWPGGGQSGVADLLPDAGWRSARWSIGLVRGTAGARAGPAPEAL